MENDEMNIATPVALATLSAQVAALVEAMARTERQLEKLDPINTSLGEMRVTLALKADTTALTVVDQKVVSWAGQIRGALFAASICFGAVQAALLAGGAYVFNHLQDHATTLAVVTQRLDSIDRTLRQQSQNQGGKTKWEISSAPLVSSSGLKAH